MIRFAKFIPDPRTSERRSPARAFACLLHMHAARFSAEPKQVQRFGLKQLRELFAEQEKSKNNIFELKLESARASLGTYSAVPLSRFCLVSSVYDSNALCAFLLNTLFLSLM